MRVLSRRSLLVASAAVAGFSRAAWAEHTVGPVKPPVAAPKAKVLTATGLVPLAELLRGQTTAVQLMFTHCSATCPIQGALFGQAQKALAAAPADQRLLSLSIDPTGDTGIEVAGWLSKYGASPKRWTGAVIAAANLDAVLDAVQGRAAGADSHTAQVYVFNRRAELVYRTPELPSAVQVTDALAQVAAAP